MQSNYRHDYFEPDSFGRAVQDNLGDAVMVQLRRKLGGREMKIPHARHGLHDDHPLVRAVGHDDAERMCEIFGGERVYFPKLNVRDDAYMKALKEGLTTGEIAKRLGVSDRHARRVLAGMGIRNPNQRPAVRRVVAPAETESDALIAAE